MWKLFLLVAGLWGLQGLLGFYQMKHFNSHFKALRQQGRVVVGRSKGRFVAGVVVLFCMDGQGRVIKAERMAGVSSFARLGSFTLFDGCDLLNLPDNPVRASGTDKQTWKAVLNAVENYRSFMEANNHASREVKPAASEQVTA